MPLLSLFMSQSAREMADSFHLFMNNVEEIAMSVIEGSDDEIVAKIQDQLMHGRDGKGHFLRDYADPDYAEFKRSLNPLGVTDWHLTGDFYAHMRVQIINKQSFHVYSNGRNYNNLLLNYGGEQMEEAMTMDNDSSNKFNEERFHPRFVVLLAAATGAGIGNG